MKTQGNLQLNIAPEFSKVIRDQFKQLYDCSGDLHVTLLFGAFQDEHTEILGEEFQIAVISHCWNDRIQALRVDLPVYLEQECQNRVPHITLSWEDGVSPVEANSLFFSTSREEVFSDEEEYEEIWVRGYVVFNPWK